MSKKIHEFHIIFRDRHIKELNEHGTTICNSPFIRKLIYRQLKILKKPYQTKVVGWGKIYRDVVEKHNPYKYANNCPSLVMNHIRKGHYNLNELLEINKTIKSYYKNDEKGFDENDIKKLFDDVDDQEKFKIVCDMCEKASEYTFENRIFCTPRKDIREISLV